MRIYRLKFRPSQRDVLHPNRTSSVPLTRDSSQQIRKKIENMDDAFEEQHPLVVIFFHLFCGKTKPRGSARLGIATFINQPWERFQQSAMNQTLFLGPILNML